MLQEALAAMRVPVQNNQAIGFGQATIHSTSKTARRLELEIEQDAV